MATPIQERLVVAVASSAIFDLSESDKVYRDQGTEEYRKFQWENRNKPLASGVAMPFVRRLLSLNDRFVDDQPVEVVLISKNSPETGLRVYKAITEHRLPITRAGFTNGQSPWRWLNGFGASLFLSAEAQDVAQAINAGHAAGTVLSSGCVDDPNDKELRIAFDFDGVLVDDEAERIYKSGGLEAFHAFERQRATQPLQPGPLGDFFKRLGHLQKRLRSLPPSDGPTLRLALITARNAAAIERCIFTLKEWDVELDDTLFLGGMEKARFLSELRPHIFFDDQPIHLESAKSIAPAVHIPFGIANVP
ncbi:MAG TPA: 5'-nucleotidase [Myxococcota bacterium]|nr:5'-nucleotidase [Myxococcota bacterium]